MLGQIDPADTDSEEPRYLLRGPLLEHIQIEQLVLLRIDLALDPFDGDVHEVLLPFLVPERGWVKAVWVRNAFNGRGPRRVGPPTMNVFGVVLAFAQLVGDAPACQAQEPRFER